MSNDLIELLTVRSPKFSHPWIICKVGGAVLISSPPGQMAKNRIEGNRKRKRKGAGVETGQPSPLPFSCSRKLNTPDTWTIPVCSHIKCCICVTFGAINELQVPSLKPSDEAKCPLPWNGNLHFNFRPPFSAPLSPHHIPVVLICLIKMARSSGNLRTHPLTSTAHMQIHIILTIVCLFCPMRCKNVVNWRAKLEKIMEKNNIVAIIARGSGENYQKIQENTSTWVKKSQ